MELDSVLQTIKNTFSSRKKVDFEEEDLHFEIEPLTSKEEIVILGSLEDLDGSQYIETLRRHTMACSIKKINDLDLSDDEIEYKDEEGKVQTKSKFFFMTDYLAKWPSLLIDTLFVAFTNMQNEMEDRIKNSAKFDKFTLSEEMEEEKPSKFRKIVEESSEGMTETERLNKRVKKEIDGEDARMSQIENETINKK